MKKFNRKIVLVFFVLLGFGVSIVFCMDAIANEEFKKRTRHLYAPKLLQKECSLFENPKFIRTQFGSYWEYTSYDCPGLVCVTKLNETLNHTKCKKIKDGE